MLKTVSFKGMMQSLTFEQFLTVAKPGSTFVLFIKERGCQYCETAEVEMTKDFLSSFKEVSFFQTSIDAEPGLPPKLGLVGVPAFFKVSSRGEKRVKTGFESLEDLSHFINSGA